MEVHELAGIIPPMTEAEYMKLREDIGRNGLRSPITLYEGQILDGRHRYRACSELGIAPATLDYQGDDPVGYVISLNLHRRHLTVGQQADIGLTAMPFYEKEAKKRQQAALDRGRDIQHGKVDSDQLVPIQPATPSERARDAAARDVGVSGATIERLRVVAKNAPDLHRQVKEGKRTVNGAYAALKERQTTRRTRDIYQPFEIKTDRDAVFAAAAKRKMVDFIATIIGWGKGLESFDLPRAVAGATEEEREHWLASLDASIKSFRDLRTRIKEMV